MGENRICFLFHDWSRWGEIEKEKWLLDGINGVRHSQTRVCNTCGKIQRRFLED